MKKTNAAIKAVGFLFFIALLTYLAVYIVQALDNPFTTTLAVSYTVRESAELYGIVVRDEEILKSAYESVLVTAENGKMVSKGQELASVFASGEELRRAVRKSELEAEIASLEARQNTEASSSDKLRREADISKRIIDMKSAVYSKRIYDIEERARELKALVFTGEYGPESLQSKLDELKTELEELGGGGEKSSAKVSAPSSGLFCLYVDGWEDLKIRDVKSITASGLARLLGETRTAPENSIGKLIYGTKWYYAALMSRDDCDSLNQGDRVNMLLGGYDAKKLRMTVESKSRSEDGKCAVIFSCDRAMTDVMNLRMQEAELVFSEYTGLRVPKKSVHVDENGKACVYVQTALQAEKKYIDIAYELGDFYVVGEPKAKSADGKEPGDALREGDQVIVSSKELYNGKVVD